MHRVGGRHLTWPGLSRDNGAEASVGAFQKGRERVSPDEQHERWLRGTRESGVTTTESGHGQEHWLWQEQDPGSVPALPTGSQPALS